MPLSAPLRIATVLIVCGFASCAPTTNAPPETTPAPSPVTSTIPKAVELWAKDVPGATGDTDEDKPAIYPFLPPADKNTGAAVLICPGGGFNTRCTDYEGVLIARWLNARGIAGFVLRYRIRPLYTMKESLQDAQRAMQHLRAHAEEYRIAPDRVGMIGFSAGAELAGTAAFNPIAAKPDATDVLDKQSSRANFLVLVYGSARFNSKDSTSAPPTFLFCTAEDSGHLTGMIDLYAELRKARVPAEVHFFEKGEHGVGFAQGDPVLGPWPGLLENWMRSSGFLTPQKRVAITGIIKVDGEALPHGHVVFTPLESIGAPPVTAYVLNSGPVRGQYTVRAERGPTPGKYKVEIYQDATRWQSNSQDPMYVKMTQKQRAGTLTDADRKEWHEYARKKNLSPSIEDVRVYKTLLRGDNKDILVDIKATGENRFDFEIVSR